MIVDGKNDFLKQIRQNLKNEILSPLLVVYDDFLGGINWKI